MAKFYFKKWPSFTLRNGEIAICSFTTTTMDLQQHRQQKTTQTTIMGENGIVSLQ